MGLAAVPMLFGVSVAIAVGDLSEEGAKKALNEILRPLKGLVITGIQQRPGSKEATVYFRVEDGQVIVQGDVVTIMNGNNYATFRKGKKGWQPGCVNTPWGCQYAKKRIVVE
jgi:hypothetical protein